LTLVNYLTDILQPDISWFILLSHKYNGGKK